MQVDEALAAGADIVLLDNLSTPDIIEAVQRCRGRAKTEISGGVTLGADAGARGDGRGLRVDRRADAFGPRRGPELRDRTCVNSRSRF